MPRRRVVVHPVPDPAGEDVLVSLAERATYRHGDLRAALVAAGLDMAREGGPEAVVLREATRRAGVSPNAAYRHFADREALVDAVSDAALGLVAAAIEEEWNGIDRESTATQVALDELAAVGRGYLRFAHAEPGLFRVAFSVPKNLEDALSPGKAGPGGRTPFELLGIALDDMVAAGVVPPERRPGAELLAWSSVHGLAMLAIGGPLRDLDPETLVATGRGVIAMVQRGI